MVNEDKGWQIEPITFGSDSPLIGPLIGTLRRLWHGIAGKWALQYVIDQQNGFNQVVGQQLLALETEHDELRREVARLHSQLQSLQSQLNSLQGDK